KEIVSISEMVDRLKAALDAKTDPDFVVMARTDALSVEGLDAAVERAVAFQEAGADMIFAEALTDIEMYRKFTDVLDIPVLANMTEFGQTDLYTTDQLYSVGVEMVLYPLSAFRAMNKAALNVYQHLLDDGTQDKVVDTMQTRMELYDFLNYHEFEQTLDKLFADNK
ncbi:MAG: isocitrate lyase/phosphoenolpyruvate mutase family protein, partial [Psychrobacter nivimaris]